MKRERTPPLVTDKPAGDASINPQLEALGSLDLDAVVGVGGGPGADVLPVPVVAHGPAGLVQEVDVVFVGAAVAAEAVGCWVWLGWVGCGEEGLTVDVKVWASHLLGFLRLTRERIEELASSVVGAAKVVEAARRP